MPPVDAHLADASRAIGERRTDDALAALEAAERSLGEQAEDPRRGELLALRAHVLRMRGDTEGAARAARAVTVRAELPGWDAAAARASTELGWLLRAGRQPAEAERRMREGVAFADRAAREDLRVPSRCALAELLALHGDGAGADRVLEEAAGIGTSAGSRLRVSLATGLVAQRLGRTREAEQSLLDALRRARGQPVPSYEASIALARLTLARGDPVSLRYARRAVRLASGWKANRVAASARMLLGEVARALGRLEEADRAYRAAERLYDRGELFALHARLNRAQVSVALGRPDRAAALAGPIRAGLATHPVGAAAAALCLVPDAASRGARGAVDELVGDAIARIAGSGSTHADLASLAEAAAFATAGAGLADAAVRLAALSHEQWRRVGHAEAPHRLGALLHRLRRPVPLGPFLLDERIADGPSGQVWRARHAASGHPVAVKVLRLGQRGVSARASFVRELRAVAGLDHPNVVTLLDHGHVDEPAAVSEPALDLDAPWLAFELAPHGTLERQVGRLPWDEAARLLAEVLEGLGHAHARGILHLDLKPSNVLLVGDPARPTAKLADFGLARAPAGSENRPAGTPAFMAPEQFGTDGTALGPWTDLYGFAGLVYALLGGEPVFGHDGPQRLRSAHRHRPHPPLRPLVPVPARLQEWLDRMLAKAPAERVQRVPDALAGLAALGVPRPIASGWDAGAVRPRPDALAAAGLGLVSLRRPGTVGRRRERAALWSSLCRVAEDRRAAMVTVTGPRGIGSRHLLQWLVERVEETGDACGVLLAPGMDADPERVLRASADHPVVVAVLDVDRVAGAVALAERLVHLENRPVLLGVTGDRRSPWLAEAPAALRLEPDPLGDDDVRALVASYLPVGRPLADAIVQRATGNPGEAIRTLRRLAEDRQLVPHPDGWQLRPGADLDTVASGDPARFRRRIESLRPDDRVAFDVLARTGSTAVADWEAACVAAGVADPAGALERLARAELVLLVGGRLLPERPE